MPTKAAYRLAVSGGPRHKALDGLGARAKSRSASSPREGWVFIQSQLRPFPPKVCPCVVLPWPLAKGRAHGPEYSVQLGASVCLVQCPCTVLITGKKYNGGVFAENGLHVLGSFSRRSTDALRFGLLSR